LSEENRKVVEEYKKAVKIREGAVLLGVFRGRNAEGSNFPYEEARGDERWYVMDAFRAANHGYLPRS
jgi:Rad3-related DNA helicase